MLDPRKIVLDDILCNDTWGFPVAGESKHCYSGVFNESASKQPVMLLLTKKWTEDPERWMFEETNYHLAGLCEGKPVMTRRPIDINVLRERKKHPDIWVLNKEIKDE